MFVKSKRYLVKDFPFCSNMCDVKMSCSIAKAEEAKFI